MFGFVCLKKQIISIFLNFRNRCKMYPATNCSQFFPKRKRLYGKGVRLKAWQLVTGCAVISKKEKTTKSRKGSKSKPSGEKLQRGEKRGIMCYRGYILYIYYIKAERCLFAEKG